MFEYDPVSAQFHYAEDFSRVTAGFEPDELPPPGERHDWWLKRVHEEDAGRLTETLREMATAGRDEARLEVRVLHRNGEWIYLDVHLNRGSYGTGPPTIVGVLRDVTVARIAEFERRELSTQVAQSNRLEALGKLAGGVAHDFNNLLTVINGNTELARDVQDRAELESLLDEVRDAGEKAGELTRQLLQFSRREPGPKKAVAINDVVAAVERILRRLIGSSIDLTTDLHPKAGSLLGDASQVEQVLFNLVTNARDALPTGGEIVISTERVLSEEGDPSVVLRVRDDGVGMPEAVKSHIFDPFFSTKSRERGTGMGLSTVYGIVTESGGRIQVATEVGQGTEFTLTFPGVEERAATETCREDMKVGGGERILIVEDDLSVARLMRLSLERGGYRVVEAADGEEALAALRLSERSISLVLTDVVMPRMGGYELIERIRDRAPALPILLVSGFADGLPASDEPDLRFLRKPFSRRQLLSEVRAAIDEAVPKAVGKAQR